MPAQRLGSRNPVAQRVLTALADVLGPDAGCQSPPSPLVMHTYFALVVKLMAAQHVSSLREPDNPGFADRLSACSDTALQEHLQAMEAGAVFRGWGIENFIDEPLLNGYLETWTPVAAAALRELAREIAGLPVIRSGDAFAGLYQALLPSGWRRELGEFYTPDWLAAWTLDRVGYAGRMGTGGGSAPEQAAGPRLLDPACGSGTFLVQALQRRIAAFHHAPTTHSVNAHTILSGIAGTDLNPLAVLAARANCLFALGDLLRGREPIHLPVHVGDALQGSPQRSFDIVVGNPPWINWEDLSLEVREQTRRLWTDYGLFSLQGHAARLGGGKKDLAMLFLYVCADRYLRTGGRIGMVVTQTMFKSRGAGEGFRRFRLGQGEHLGVIHVDDLAQVTVFPGAGNRTALVVMVKGTPTRYPVSYTLWRREASSRGAEQVGRPPRSHGPSTAPGPPARHVGMHARPVDSQVPTSPWLTLPQRGCEALTRLLGPSPYRAYAGAYTGGLNGAFWVRVLDRADGLVRVENLYQFGRTPVPRVEAVLEPDLIYPLLRGRDVKAWHGRPSAHMVLAQDPVTRRGFPEERMAADWPLTHAYLRRFEELLRARRSAPVRQLMDTGPFYSMYAVGAYTMAAYKVVWREQASRLTCAVIGSSSLPEPGSAKERGTIGSDVPDGGSNPQGEGEVRKPIIPDHKLMMVPCQDESEAHYLCAVLHSSPVRLIVKGYGLETSTSTHVLGYVRVPAYNAQDPCHQKLAQVSRRAHAAVGQGVATGQRGGAESGNRIPVAVVSGTTADTDPWQQEVDRIAGTLWGLSRREVQDLATVYKELC